MQAVIFSSPGRHEMIKALILELEAYSIDVAVINDPATYGKQNFWRRYQQAIDICLRSGHDDYLILPDDISQLDIVAIKNMAHLFSRQPFVVNIITDNRTSCWGSIVNYEDFHEVGDYTLMHFGFFDCAGLTNRRTLSRLKIDPISPDWFKSVQSSGVGHQITRKLQAMKVPMYHTRPALCYHGTHESAMHPEVRKSTPLISKPKRPRIIVGMATFKGREKVRAQAIESLKGQVDEIILYDNEHNPDLTDNGKYYGLTMCKEPVYYFSCDDDLLYPPTYIEDMIAAIEQHKCIVTHHGRILRGIDYAYYTGHLAFRCLGAVNETQQIDVPGTGVTGFRTDYFNPVGIHQAEDKKMADLVIGLEAAKQDKRIMLLKHSEGYIKQLTIEPGTAIYDTEHKSAYRQQQLANEIYKIKH